MPEIIEEDDIAEVSFTEGKVKTDASRYYIDDIELTKVLSEWRGRCDEAKLAGQERPGLPPSAGRAIMDMADAMGTRYNFSGYSYLEEMKSDALIHCIKYIHNFNPLATSKKSRPSAFAYINMIIWRSFTNRIEIEKREQYLKYVSFDLMGGMDAFKGEDSADLFSAGDEGGEQLTIGVVAQDFLQKAQEYEDKYINNKPKKLKKPKPGKDYDNFMFDLNEELPEDDTI